MDRQPFAEKIKLEKFNKFLCAQTVDAGKRDCYNKSVTKM